MSLGAKGREAQLATWKCWGIGDGAFGTEDFGIDREGVAVGRVEGEVGRLRLTKIERRRKGMPW